LWRRAPSSISITKKKTKERTQRIPARLIFLCKRASTETVNSLEKWIRKYFIAYCFKLEDSAQKKAHGCTSVQTCGCARIPPQASGSTALLVCCGVAQIWWPKKKALHLKAQSSELKFLLHSVKLPRKKEQNSEFKEDLQNSGREVGEPFRIWHPKTLRA